MSIAFFLEMGWKSALIAGAALMLVSLLRTRTAPERAAVLRIGVAMLLLLPLIAVGLPALEVEALPAPYVPPADLLTYAPADLPASATQPTIWDDPTILFAILYAGGLAMALLHLVAGLWTLRRWTADSAPVDSAEWLAAFARVRASMPSRRPVRLVVADELSSPLSWGWARPVIMVDRDTLAMVEDSEAILAHEWAHVIRQDWPVLMASRLVSALFWFNPLVWMLEREIVQQAEEAADCFASRSVEPARYAQTLVKWAQFGTHGLPANSMAPATAALARRVRAILEGGPRKGQARSVLTLAAMGVCATFAAALAAVELIPVEAVAAPAPAPAPARIATAAPAAPAAPASREAVAAPQAPAAPARVRAAPAAAPEAPAAVEAPAAQAAPPAPEPGPSIAKVMIAPHPAPEPLPQPLRLSLEHLERSRPEIAQAIGEARRAGRTVRLAVDERRIERQVDHAVREAHRARARACRSTERGAAQMERGAEGMAAAAARFRDPAQRERAIARARARGETLTHEQLIELSREMEEGARDLRDGARDLRRSAAEMRRTS